MPEIARMPPGRRLFARIDRFECACPNCGRLIFASLDKTHLPTRMKDTSRARAAAKQRPHAESVRRLGWNPYTQRLCCPWCDHVYAVGMLFYPVTQRGRRLSTPAPDTEPTAAEVAEMRRLSGGWFVKGGKRPQDPANLLVTAECSCPELGTAPSCPLHGEAVLGQPAAPLPPRPRRHFSEYVTAAAAEAAEAEATAAEGGESPSK